jgi:hypothetical protein
MMLKIVLIKVEAGLISAKEAYNAIDTELDAVIFDMIKKPTFEEAARKLKYGADLPASQEYRKLLKIALAKVEAGLFSAKEAYDAINPELDTVISEALKKNAPRY